MALALLLLRVKGAGSLQAQYLDAPRFPLRAMDHRSLLEVLRSRNAVHGSVRPGVCNHDFHLNRHAFFHIQRQRKARRRAVPAATNSKARLVPSSSLRLGRCGISALSPSVDLAGVLALGSICGYGLENLCLGCQRLSSHRHNAEELDAGGLTPKEMTHSVRPPSFVFSKGRSFPKF